MTNKFKRNKFRWLAKTTSSGGEEEDCPINFIPKTWKRGSQNPALLLFDFDFEVFLEFSCSFLFVSRKFWFISHNSREKNLNSFEFFIQKNVSRANFLMFFLLLNQELRPRMPLDAKRGWPSIKFLMKGFHCAVVIRTRNLSSTSKLNV